MGWDSCLRRKRQVSDGEDAEGFKLSDQPRRSSTKLGEEICSDEDKLSSHQQSTASSHRALTTVSGSLQATKTPVRGKDKWNGAGLEKQRMGRRASSGSVCSGKGSTGERESVAEAAAGMSIGTEQVVAAILVITIVAAASATLFIYLRVARRVLAADILGPVECEYLSNNGSMEKPCLEEFVSPCKRISVRYTTSQDTGTALLLQYFHSYDIDNECSAHACGDQRKTNETGSVLPLPWERQVAAMDNSTFECFLDRNKPGYAFLYLEEKGTSNIVMSHTAAYLVLTVPGTCIVIVFLALIYCFFAGHMTAEPVTEKVMENYIPIGNKYKRIPGKDGEEKSKRKKKSKEPSVKLGHESGSSSSSAQESPRDSFRAMKT